MKPSIRTAMKLVAGGKVIYCLSNDKKKTLWVNRDGEKLTRRGLDMLRGDGWIRMEELPDPPSGIKAWYRVLLSDEGRRIWMPEGVGVQTGERSGVNG